MPEIAKKFLYAQDSFVTVFNQRIELIAFWVTVSRDPTRSHPEHDPVDDALSKFIKAPVFSYFSIGRDSYGSPPSV